MSDFRSRGTRGNRISPVESRHRVASVCAALSSRARATFRYRSGPNGRGERGRPPSATKGKVPRVTSPRTADQTARKSRYSRRRLHFKNNYHISAKCSQVHLKSEITLYPDFRCEKYSQRRDSGKVKIVHRLIFAPRVNRGRPAAVESRYMEVGEVRESRGSHVWWRNSNSTMTSPAAPARLA
ncbi:hypothetical protein EVAR_46700_1 [Eumeta japonica]|uniref:Uncharacterized protein n=1 Tax=Eumeta variegata TaxID=151549 RepID=A0A4C1Y6Y3_EUMVA|nr:hypothetical protein EVAR_46700_1 [Eumeta japonica]